MPEYENPFYIDPSNKIGLYIAVKDVKPQFDCFYLAEESDAARKSTAVAIQEPLKVNQLEDQTFKFLKELARIHYRRREGFSW